MESLSKVLNFVKRYNKDAFVFQAGGSLLDHPTRDIDVLVMIPDSAGNKDLFVKYVTHNKDYFQELRDIDEIYGEENKYQAKLRFNMPELYHLSGDKGYIIDQDAYDLVVKVTEDGVDIDMLIIFDNKNKHDFIFTRMGFFPLSIQQIALDLETGILWKSSWQENPEILYSNKGKSYQKYKLYYPERGFLSIEQPLPGLIPF